MQFCKRQTTTRILLGILRVWMVVVIVSFCIASAFGYYATTYDSDYHHHLFGYIWYNDPLTDPPVSFKVTYWAVVCFGISTYLIYILYRIINTLTIICFVLGFVLLFFYSFGCFPRRLLLYFMGYFTRRKNLELDC